MAPANPPPLYPIMKEVPCAYIRVVFVRFVVRGTTPPGGGVASTYVHVYALPIMHDVPYYGTSCLRITVHQYCTVPVWDSYCRLLYGSHATALYVQYCREQ